MSRSRHPISFVATTDAGAAEAFYGGCLGLALLEVSPFALVFRDGNTTLRVQIVADLSPAPHTVHGWQVTDIEHEIEELTFKGVTTLRYDQMSQDALGIWTSPDGHKIAWFKDPGGNILSLTQFMDA